MTDEIMKKELQRIVDELDELFDMLNEDYSKDKSRYNMGLMVGIGYARRELERVVKRK